MVPVASLSICELFKDAATELELEKPRQSRMQKRKEVNWMGLEVVLSIVGPLFDYD